MAHWRAAVPAGFVFSVKASRYITHMKKLKDPEHTLPPFLARIAGLGERLGPLLFQLPPRWGRYDDRALAAWAGRIIAWAGEGRAVYGYFDNDEAGHAALDAGRLLRMLGP